MRNTVPTGALRTDAAILFMLPFTSTSHTGKYIISEIFINNF